MSHTLNERYLEEKNEEFEYHISVGNLSSARAVVDELFDKGFNLQGLSLGKSIINKQMSV